MIFNKITLSVFSLVMIGFLLLGSQNIHTLAYHSDDHSDSIIHCEQCDFIYTNNQTSFLDYGYTTIQTPYIFTEINASFYTDYKQPQVKNIATSSYLNKPPPTV
ncbi:MAG: hypothetical protein ABJD66_03700 [Cellulophaga sp.]|uniref:hypothetical protein n=1 Tax=unclassified Cellulophaga TaxID=2634405 RepID=UPI0026E3D2D4|nr:MULTISPECIES: hypothetical protein [unclassified Cellulophaga]MDO6490420.1 hypothetical protein [Cellulophaga sp. 2_MG-2023]MDO6494386.1 hypothetical protein [Cellulophaga sp. 3_MG-2023]